MQVFIWVLRAQKIDNICRYFQSANEQAVHNNCIVHKARLRETFINLYIEHRLK